MNRGEQDDSWGGQPGDQSYVATRSNNPLVVRGRALPAVARPGGFSDTETSEFNILKYWYLLVKHRWLIAGAVGACVLLGLVVTMLTTPIYRASTTIQIDREMAQIVDMEGVEPASRMGDREFYQTQYALLESRSLVERVVERLNLADDPNFMGTGPRRFSFLGGSRQSAAVDRATRERRAVSILASNLKIDPVRGSRLVRISYESPNPQLAARVANAVAENFIGSNLDRRFEATSYARKFLEERLAQTKAKLEETEKQLVAYAQREQIINVGAGSDSSEGGSSDSGSQSLTASNLVAMNEALSQAKNARIQAEQRWRQAAATNGMALPEILSSPTVQQLRRTRAELMAQYQEKLSVYKPDFPTMVQMKAQIDEIDRQIATEVSTVKQSLQAQYQIASRQEAQLQQQVTGLTSGVLDLRNRGIQYNILQREVDTNRTLYDGLLQRYKEIGVAGGLGTNNVSIVDVAEPPRSPAKPNLMFNLGVAAALGLLLGLAAALGLESLDETVKVPEDIEGKLGIPLLGSIPALDKGITPQEAMADPRSAFSEAYYSVRTALQFSTNEGVPPNLLVTSARPSEGKSTSAAALARNFAKLGISVLLVDGDLRNPSLHRIMQAENSAGLSNYLTGRTPLAELVQVTDQPNLAFMPCGPLPPNPAELLAGSRVRALLEEANKVFDLVIIDGPPVMGLADAPMLASATAGTMLVIEAGGTRQGLVKAALRRLDLGHARILGALLTKFSVRQAGYGYGYGYAYAYDYDYGAKQITES